MGGFLILLLLFVATLGACYCTLIIVKYFLDRFIEKRATEKFNRYLELKNRNFIRQ